MVFVINFKLKIQPGVFSTSIIVGQNVTKGLTPRIWYHFYQFTSTVHVVLACHRASHKIFEYLAISQIWYNKFCSNYQRILVCVVLQIMVNAVRKNNHPPWSAKKKKSFFADQNMGPSTYKLNYWQYIRQVLLHICYKDGILHSSLSYWTHFFFLIQRKKKTNTRQILIVIM